MDLVAANTLQQKKIFHPSHVYRASHFFFMRMTSSPLANEQIYVFRSSRMSSYISVCDHQTAHEYEKNREFSKPATFLSRILDSSMIEA